MSMKIKKKLLNNPLGIILLISLFMILLVNLNIFKKTYDISNNNINNRLTQKYGFCSGEGYGFIKYIKNKYKLRKNPVIINYVSYPSPYWMLENTNIELSKNDLILINYPNNYLINFKKKNKNEFINSDLVEYSTGIKKINIILEKVENVERVNIKIDIIKLFHNKEKLIKTFLFDENFNNKISIPVNFSTDQLNSRWEKILIRTQNNNSIISKISLDMQNLYDPNLKKIIENHGRCYYVKQ